MKRLTLILTLLTLLAASQADAQRVRYVQTTVPCTGPQCPAPAAKPAEPAPAPKPETAAPVESPAPSPKPQAPPAERLDPMLAETLLRGDSLVDTSAEIHATADMIYAAAASLPEDDREKFYCTVYHDDMDAESKALLEAWKTSDTLRALADPLVPNSASAKCKFLTVNINDVTQRPLIEQAAVTRTPCVIIQSAKIDTPGVPKNTQFVRIYGYAGNLAAYEKEAHTAFKTGLNRIAEKQIAAYVPETKSGAAQASSRRTVPPKIQPITTLDRQKVEPEAGLDFHVNVPELPPELVTPAVDLLNNTNNGFKELQAVAIKALWVLVIGVLVIISIPKLIIPTLRMVSGGLKNLAIGWWESVKDAWRGKAKSDAEPAPAAEPAPIPPGWYAAPYYDPPAAPPVEMPPEIAVTPTESDAEKIARLERQLAAQKSVSTRYKNKLAEYEG